MEQWSNHAAALGLRVRQRRKQLGFSQEQFAMHAGIDRSYMGGIERGQRNVTLFILCDLAKALGCEVAELLQELPTAKSN